MIFQNLLTILPSFFRFERQYYVPKQKIKKSEATFVAINMMNKCAKFHTDSVDGEKGKFNHRERLIFRRLPLLCTTL